MHLCLSTTCFYPQIIDNSFIIIIIINSNERSEYSYIGLADFFSGKSLKICSRLVLIYRGLTSDFFLSSSSICIVKRKANSTIEQQKCEGHENCD